MLELLRSTGCSLEELVALRAGDVEVEARTVQFLSYSGYRRSRLDERAWYALDAYLQGQEESSNVPLFCDANGAPLTVERAYEMLQGHATRLGMREKELRRML